MLSVTTTLVITEPDPPIVVSELIGSIPATTVYCLSSLSAVNAVLVNAKPDPSGLLNAAIALDTALEA